MRDPYYQFLCACLSLDREAALTSVRDPNWNWEQLFQRANEEAVLPALDRNIRELGPGAFIPSEISDFMSAVESLNRERNTAILDELKTAVILLNEAGIQPILLKGAAYVATRVYINAGDRYLGDLDLLVPESQLGTAVEVLMLHGFAPDPSDRFGAFRHHHPPLSRPGAISIELHHSLGLGACALLLPAAEVIENSLVYDLEGITVRVPCPQHLLTHLIMHSQMHHSYSERIWPPLRAMYDFARLQSRFGAALRWPAIEQRFREAGLYDVLALHVLQVCDSVRTDAPITLRLTPFTRLRRFRREALRIFPPLRYLDPMYMFSIVCTRRLRVLRVVLSSSGGRKYLIRQMLELSLYQRIFIDVLEGRGR